MQILTGLLNVLLVLSSIFLIFLILIQRGKGGGLAGAFGGVGGSSAFGTKAGDVFTKITIYTALVWFLLNMLLVVRMNQRRASVFEGTDKGKAVGKQVPGAPKPSDKNLVPPATTETTPAKGVTIPPPPSREDRLPDPLSETPEDFPAQPFAEPRKP